MNDLLEKLTKKKRLNEKEALALYELPLEILAPYANTIRKEKFGKKTFFNINHHINPTNICKDVCQFCAYSASRKNPDQYTLSHDTILNLVETSYKQNSIDEVHIVSAHNPHEELAWYFDLFSKIKTRFPTIHIKALTAAEIHFLAEHHNKSYEQILAMMIENGVDSMPGGGAEIFDPTIRQRICGGKVTASQWLAIHKMWHNLGKQSNATMLFGHIESRQHRIEHMAQLRNLQDETNGFNAFIPLIYQTRNNYLKVAHPLTANEFLKTIAIARIFFDNIEHIKAYWATSTIKLALVAQEYGADDLDGTIQKESIQSAAGANSKNGIELQTLLALIQDSGFIATQRDSLYNEIQTF